MMRFPGQDPVHKDLVEFFLHPVPLLLILLTAGSAGSAAPFPPGTTPDWQVTGHQASCNFGSSASAAGDVNGDGYGDVIVGAYNYDHGEQDEGMAFLYLGSANGLATVPAWTAESNQAFAVFGLSVAGAGDVNGDGYDDVLVGARCYAYQYDNAGRVYLYQGGPNGLSVGPTWVLDGDREMARLGNSVASAGDVNGDGFDDVIVGAPRFTEDKTDQGLAMVILGSPQGLSDTPAWKFRGDVEGANLGWCVSSAGDVNGDGYDDVIVGADQRRLGQKKVGAAFLFLGSPTGLSQTPAWIHTGSELDEYYGFSVASAGDVNGDGYGDVLVGAPYFDGGSGDQGKVELYLGSVTGLASTPARTILSASNGAWLGYSAQTAGDVNGDGFSDFLVSAPMMNSWRGQTQLFPGGPSGPDDEAVWMLEGTQSWGVLGECVSGAGDVNGDGFSDFLIGTGYLDGQLQDEGGVLLFHGSAPDPSIVPSGGGESLKDLICPNPFRAGTEMIYTVRTTGLIRLTIHDLSGRLLATLMDGGMGPGRHTVLWDGRNRSGDPVPSGIYFARFRAGSRASTTRFTLQRGGE